MRYIGCIILTAAILVALTADRATAADPAALSNWPQWRGPLNTGAAPQADPPVEWNQDKNIKWKVAVPGEGNSTPIIWGEQVFVQTAVPTGKKAEPAPEAKSTEPAAAAQQTPPAAQAPEGAAPPADGAASGGEGRRGRRGGGGGGGGMRSVEPTEQFQFVLMCLDRQTGRTLWQQIAREELPHEGHHPDNTFSSHSPVSDGTCVIAYFGSRGLHCYDMNGKLKWSKDFGRMTTKNAFGEGSSPALHGNTVVVIWDHDGDDFIVALDKESGRELWRTPREEDTSWSTPLVVEFGGGAQVITAATQRIRSYDLKTGEMLWDSAGLTTNAIPSPVAAGNMVYATSGFRGSKLVAIRLGTKGDLTGTDAIVWNYDKDTPYVPSPLLSGDRLYFFKGNTAVLSCIDVKTGSLLYTQPERLEGISNVYASPVSAGGRVYLVGRDGTTLVINDGDKLEVLATNSLGESVDASPAIAGKQLYLRGKQNLYCVGAE